MNHNEFNKSSKEEQDQREKLPKVFKELQQRRDEFDKLSKAEQDRKAYEFMRECADTTVGGPDCPFHGVFQIVCIPRNRAFISGGGPDLWLLLEEFVIALLRGQYHIDELSDDIKKYEPFYQNFSWKILDCDPEYKDRKKLLQAIEEAKKSWPGDLYE